jgi:hypothetical protein
MKHENELATIKAYIDKTGDTTTFPYKLDSYCAKAVIDESIEFDDFIKQPEIQYSIYNYKYSRMELKSMWKSIIIHRLKYKALLLVMAGEFKAINPAIEYVKGVS